MISIDDKQKTYIERLLLFKKDICQTYSVQKCMIITI